jgi:hypothetical protein
MAASSSGRQLGRAGMVKDDSAARAGVKFVSYQRMMIRGWMKDWEK